MADLDVVILTFNEARHIERAIQAVSIVANQIFVIDSYSTDETTKIAEACGAIVLRHKFVNYAAQFSWALNHAPISAGWVMRLDADELIESDLASEINQNLNALPEDVTGVFLDRKHIFMGRWIRHGGRYPLSLLRIWRKGAAVIEDRWMDEHMVLIRGRGVSFAGGFSDWNLNDLGFFTDKHNKYATREAIDVLLHKYPVGARQQSLQNSHGGSQAGLKRLVKERIYNRLPLFVGPASYFLFRYILQRGFLDGKEGLIYHFLQGFWYRFLVQAKVKEITDSLGDDLFSSPRFLDRLAELTGYSVTDAFDSNSRDEAGTTY